MRSRAYDLGQDYYSLVNPPPAAAIKMKMSVAAGRPPVVPSKTADWRLGRTPWTW